MDSLWTVYGQSMDSDLVTVGHMADVVTVMEVRVEACARRTPQPDCPLVDTLEEMVAGRGVFVDSVRQVLVFTDGHQVKGWCCGCWGGGMCCGGGGCCL